jgi:IS30 family transposase
MTYREKFHLEDFNVSESTIYNAIHSPKIKTLKPYMMLLQYRRGKKYVFKEGKRINGESIDSMCKVLFNRNISCV